MLTSNNALRLTEYRKEMEGILLDQSTENSRKSNLLLFNAVDRRTIFVFA